MDLHMSTHFDFLDFFAGSGLVTEGLKDRFHAVWANDICALKTKVYRANHPKDQFLQGSIEVVEGESLPHATLAWASFPCQDLSLAGKLQGIGASRSGLVWHWLRVLREMPEKPPILVAENVVGLVSNKGGEHYRALHASLTNLGYMVGAIVLDAACWVPQSRPRVFVIAAKKGADLEGFTDREPSWLHPRSVLGAASGLKDFLWWRMPPPPPRKSNLCDLIDFKAPYDDEEKARKNIALIPDRHLRKLTGARRFLKVAAGYRRTRSGRQVLELRFDGLAGCLRTPEGGSSRQYVVIPRDDRIDTRLLTVREAARLMGAPESYRLPGVTDSFRLDGSYNEGYKAMGDAVAAPVARYLSENLLAPLAGRLDRNKSIYAA